MVFRFAFPKSVVSVMQWRWARGCSVGLNGGRVLLVGQLVGVVAVVLADVAIMCVISAFFVVSVSVYRCNGWCRISKHFKIHSICGKCGRNRVVLFVFQLVRTFPIFIFQIFGISLIMRSGGFSGFTLPRYSKNSNYMAGWNFHAKFPSFQPATSAIKFFFFASFFFLPSSPPLPLMWVYVYL